MEAWESIEKTIDYIEENMEHELNVEELANIANLSPFYFQKLFKRLVGKTAIEYIKFRRLSKAAEEIKINKKENILDICLKYGFNNAENFSRCFKDAYGITPSQYRSNPILLSHFLKPEIFLQYNIIDEDVPVVTDGIVLEVSRIFLEKEKYFAGFIEEAVIEAPSVDPLADVWNKLHNIKANIECYLPEGNELGVNLKMNENGNVEYFAGAETSKEIQDDSLEKYILARGNYIICKFEAENFYTLVTETIDKVYKYMHLWITRKELNVLPTAIEMYYGSTPEKTYMELWIPISD